ncbi:MFS transporter [Fimbriimonas ginsengisoli]|uniref:Major facilitator superfamily MFS_1 n=1 Tax=Fimbriimonas ginsengisoli Gsoil 348 TaxID=661478 RepID=A0A068NTN7_FIMGI|nr:MFS transporter [Fimbriimonas ginsengisoli]AIE86806.1 major facilitator superfamily MFS_1 [Fimbriimonas ginsengisoli Gsoil 348]
MPPESSPPPPNGRGKWQERLSGSKLVRVLSYHDFRLLWIGAFVSFTGSWIQSVAQGYFVYQLTQDESKLAWVSFCGSIPVFLLGFVAGSLADTLNKRTVLVVTQSIYAAGALYLAVATEFGFVQYWQIIAVAFALGLVGCVEMPTRQSIVSRVVPPEDLAAAVPVNAMTFNVARIFGPAVGVLILTKFGVAACYLLNGVSFIALIWAAMAIKSSLAVQPRQAQPIMDLIFEGAIYTWREARLRTLLVLETITAIFGIFYIPLIPAYIDQALGLGTTTGAHPDAAKAANGAAYTAMGIGAMLGLVLITALSDSPHKAHLIRGSMGIIGFGLILLAFIRVPIDAYIVIGFVGGSTIIQFNSTNALFQILAPERLRGRVLSMHIWALNGLSPFGVLAFGYLAKNTRMNVPIHGLLEFVPQAGVRLSLLVGGSVVLLASIISLFASSALTDLNDGPSTA